MKFFKYFNQLLVTAVLALSVGTSRANESLNTQSKDIKFDPDFIKSLNQDQLDHLHEVLQNSGFKLKSENLKNAKDEWEFIDIKKIEQDKASKIAMTRPTHPTT